MKKRVTNKVLLWQEQSHTLCNTDKELVEPVLEKFVQEKKM